MSLIPSQHEQTPAGQPQSLVSAALDEGVGQKADAISRVNPQLGQSPDALDALSQVKGVPGHVIGGATKFLTAGQDFKDITQSHANQVPHAGSWWSDVTNFASGTWNGVKQMGSGLLHVANRGLMTAGEDLSGGALGNYGLGHFSQNLNDASTTVRNFSQTALNPLEDWRLLGRTYAYWNSQVARHGTAYTAGELFPMFASSLLGGEALDTAGVGVGADAGKIADSANLTKLDAAIARGTATSDMMAQRMAVVTRMLRRENIDAQGGIGVENMSNAVANSGTAFEKTFRAGDRVAQWGPGLLVKGAGRALTGQFGGTRLNLLYGLTATHAAGSPESQALWDNPYVAQGIPVDVHGRPTVSTFGTSVANALGAHQGMLEHALATGADIGQFFASEPAGLAIGLSSSRATAEGAGALLGHWWPGIGVESGADVLRTQDAIPSTRRAYEFIANNGLAAIKKAFPRMYSDEQYLWLAKAHTVEDVVNIHADIANAVGLTRNIAPTLGLGRFLLTKMRGGLMVWQKVSENFSGLEQAAKETLDHYGVVDFKPTSAAEASGDPIIRGNAALRRWVAAKMTHSTMYVVDAKNLGTKPFVETKVMSTSDKGAINAIGDFAKQVGIFNDREIATMLDTLHAIPAGADMGHAITNLTAALVHGGLTRLTDAAVMQPIDSMIKIQLEDLTKQLFKFTEGGNGHYVNGELGSAMDDLRNPADATQVGKFGIAKAHVGNMVIPDPRYGRNMITDYAKALMHTVGRHMSVVADLSSAEQVQQAAEFSRASLENMAPEIGARAAQRLQALQRTGREAASAYEEEANKIISLINSSRAERQFTKAEQFARVLTNINAKTDLLSTATETDKSLTTAAQLWANRDALTMLKSKITDLGVSDTQVSVIARRIADTSGVTGPAREKLFASVEDELRKARDNQGNYATGLNHVANGLNHVLSTWFVPLMLSTGGYIMRITGGEVLLNIARIGAPQYVQSMIARSVAKKLGEVGRKPIEFKFAEHTIAEQIGHLMGGVGKTVADTMKGTAYGAASGIAKSIDTAEFGRLLDRAAELRALHDTWPDVGHTTTQLFGESEFRQGSRQMVYGMKDETVGGTTIKVPKMTRGYRGGNYVSADGTNAVTALRDQISLAAYDPMLKYSAQHLQTLMDAAGYKTLNQNEFNQLWKAMTEVEHQRILSLPSHELSALRSSTWPLSSPELTTGDPINDLAKRISYNTLSLGLDKNKVNDWAPSRMIIDAMSTGVIPDSASLSRELEKAGTAGPMAKHLVTSQFTRFPWSDGVSGLSRLMDKFIAAPSYINQMVVDRLFGRTISYMSREPIYLWEYHKAMDALSEKVGSNIISHEDAMLSAQNEAFHRTLKFVHNPADRFNYEARTRAYAPFWFAKNQMYRRAARVFENDPAAFYNYLRMSTLATVGVSRYETANAPAWILPFADTPAWLVAQAAKFFPTGLPKYLANGLGFTLAGSPTSLTSTLVTGTNYAHVPAGSAWSAYLEAAAKDVGSGTRPDVSPPVAIGLLELQSSGLGHTQWYDKAVKTILGPIGVSQGILANLIPSTVYRGALTSVLAVADMQTGNGMPGPIAQLEVRAQNALYDKWMGEFVNEYRKGNPIPPGTVPSQTYVNNETTWAQFEMTQALHDTTKAANFMNEARGMAFGLYVSRLMVDFSSPVSVYLKEQFSKAGNLDKYLSMKDIHGNPLSFSQGMALYSYHEPGNVLDTVSHYQDIYGTYPATQQAVSWIQKAPEVIREFPYFSATLLPASGKFDYAAVTAEINANLRTYDTPAQYQDAVLKTMGDNFYYNYLEPEYYKAFGKWVGPNSPGNTISFAGYKALQTAAGTYARTSNLVWSQLGSPLSEVSKSRESTTVTEATSFLANPKAQNAVVAAGLLSSSDIQSLSTAMQYYNSQITLIHSLSGTAKYNVKQGLSTVMNENAAKPVNANIASFLQMLARTPTK